MAGSPTEPIKVNVTIDKGACAQVIVHFKSLKNLFHFSPEALAVLESCVSTVVSPVLTLPTPLPLPERQAQTLTQSQCQSILLAMSQAQLHPPIPVLPPSLQTQLSEFCFL